MIGNRSGASMVPSRSEEAKEISALIRREWMVGKSRTERIIE